MGFGRGKLGRMRCIHYIPWCKLTNPHKQGQSSTLGKISLPNSNLGSRILNSFLVVLVSMKAYHMAFSALNLWGHFIWLKNNWFFCYYTECFSSPSHSENEPSWKLFLPCYVQIKPDLIVIALDKCHSMKWSRVVSLISLDGWMPLFLLKICPTEFSSLNSFQYSAPYPTVPGLRHFHLYTQINISTVN